MLKAIGDDIPHYKRLCWIPRNNWINKNAFLKAKVSLDFNFVSASRLFWGKSIGLSCGIFTDPETVSQPMKTLEFLKYHFTPTGH